MIRRPPKSTRTYTLFPYTTLFLSILLLWTCALTRSSRLPSPASHCLCRGSVMADESSENLLMRTADIVAAHVSNNSVAIADLPDVIRRIHAALSGLGTPTEAAPEELKPAISIRASLKQIGRAPF